MERDNRVARVEAENLDSLGAQRLRFCTLEGCEGIGTWIGIRCIVYSIGGLIGIGGGGVILTLSWRADRAMVGAKVQVEIEGLARSVAERLTGVDGYHLCLCITVLVLPLVRIHVVFHVLQCMSIITSNVRR